MLDAINLVYPFKVGQRVDLTRKAGRMVNFERYAKFLVYQSRMDWKHIQEGITRFRDAKFPDSLP